MTKAEFIDKMSEKTGFTKKDNEAALKAVLETIQETVVDGDSISFIGFGTFSVSERAAREGKNPATGEKIKIPATKVPKFKPGSAFKEAVNAKKGKKKK